MSHCSTDNKSPDILVSASEFFTEMVELAFEERNMESKPLTRKYLSDLLQFYLVSDNLFEEPNDSGRSETMAEKLLKAISSGQARKQELLKRLGDTTLYVSGIFGDSFKRKIIDIDYYVEIGGCAYGSLAGSDSGNIYNPIFEDLSVRFMEYVDVLTVISQKSFIQNNDDLLRLYDRYILTGSELAEEQLQEIGMLHSSVKKHRQ